MRLNKNQQGFTLVELLIVIVIIGILAAIVLTVLNPARQQARARDAVVIATMNKIATEVKAFAASNISSTTGYFPSCDELRLTLTGASACTSSAFTITGVNSATGLISFRYTNTTDTAFCISAPANDTSSGAYIMMNNSTLLAPTKSATACP